MGFISYCMNLSLYIMSSCLKRYSVFNLILQMHAGQRSRCGVIVVDAGRSRSTNLGRDAYIMITPGYRHNYLKFYQLPNSNLFIHRLLFFSREGTSEIYSPQVSSLLYLPSRSILFSFVFRSINPKTQEYLAAIFIYLFYLGFPRDPFIQSTTILPILLPVRD